MSLQVSPEIEAKIREEASARGVSVDAVLDEAARLLEKRRNAPVSRRVENYVYPAREMDWIMEPDMQYVNQWVALDGDRVVAHGSSAKAAYDEAHEKGVASPFMHFVREPHPDPLLIGWLGWEKL